MDEMTSSTRSPRPAPALIDGVFTAEDFKRLAGLMAAQDHSVQNQSGFGRVGISDLDVPELVDYANKARAIVRKTTGSKTLLHTYTLYSYYYGNTANLPKHTDNNACTYTLDLMIRYGTANWGLFVEGQEYFVEPNQGLVFYGNDQEHWRGDFPNPNNNGVAVVFFHYAEPDHWYFTKGRDYVNVINGTWTEAEWEKRHER
jgi:hypothetical protein